MSEIKLTSDITVEEVRHCGNDASIVGDARLSTRGLETSDEENYGLIRSLLRNKPTHSVPFEHSLLTVQAHAPAFVWWEWTRHRFQPVDVPGLSFSLQSGRYRPLEPVFWVPRQDRNIKPAPDHKPMRPHFVSDKRLHELTLIDLEHGYREAWAAYSRMIAEDVANEVARAVLGFGVYYAGRASGSVLAWLHFLARRTRTPGTDAAGFPQAEIEDAARQVETIFAAHWPLTHRAWNELGRGAP